MTKHETGGHGKVTKTIERGNIRGVAAAIGKVFGNFDLFHLATLSKDWNAHTAQNFDPTPRTLERLTPQDLADVDDFFADNPNAQQI